MSDCQTEIPEMEKLQTKIDWTTVTKEGNKFCQSLNKIIKNNNASSIDNFKNDFIVATNDLLDKARVFIQ